LQDLDSPFAEFLKKLHGVSGALKVGHPFGPSIHSVIAEAGQFTLTWCFCPPS
jgi:hypothetical protein